VPSLGAVVGAGLTTARRGALLAAVHEAKEKSIATAAKITIHLFFMIVRNLLDFAPIIGWLETLPIMMEILRQFIQLNLDIIFPPLYNMYAPFPGQASTYCKITLYARLSGR
jgi:hypothetical protein